MMEVAAAWEHRSEAPAYAIHRIVWLQLALLYTWQIEEAEMDSAKVTLGRLKTVLPAKTRTANGRWTRSSRTCKLRLSAAQYQLLAALVAAMSEATDLPALEQFPTWRNAQPQPLE